MAKGVSTIGTASQQAAKLRTQGFIAFEIDGALGRISKVGKGKPPRSKGLERRLIRMATFAATYLAHIKRRAMRGDLASKAKPYSTETKGARPYIVSQGYSQRTPAGDDNIAKHSADWHRKAGSVPGNTTGLMWRGAQARNRGNRLGVIDFAGSSIGTTSISRIRERRRRGGKVERVEKLGKKVRNQWKASAVYRALGVNVIAPTEKEVTAGADMFNAAAMDHIADVLDLRKVRARGTRGDRRLFTELTRQMRRRAGRG